MKNKLFASVPNILFGALITIAPQTFAHACTGHDMPGACHYSQQAATGIGVGLYAPPPGNATLNPAAVTPAGGDLPHNNMMPYLSFYFCIALQGVFPPRG